MGSVRFGVSRELVAWMRDAYGVSTFIETGTNRAETAAWAADNFASVVSVEGSEALYGAAQAAHGHRTNLRFVLGDSRVCLPEIVRTLREPAIFWLDAHWCGETTFGESAECPVLEELAAINESSLGHLVLVDDARLFLAPPPRFHNAAHWPDLGAISHALAGPSPQGRYLAVHEDVLIGVPWLGRDSLVDYLRSAAEAPSPEPVTSSRPKWFRRLGGLWPDSGVS